MKTEPELTILKYLQGAISPAEEAELMAWVIENQANKKKFEDSVAAWKITGYIPQHDFSTHDEWDKLADKLKINNTPEEQKFNTEPGTRNHFHLKNSWLIGMAATISILIVFYFAFQPFSIFQNQFELVYTNANELKEITLPDGSQAYLNESSSISFPKSFENDERKIVLQGEAFFEVVNLPQRPFVIQAGTVTTKVLGTSFNIKTSASNDTIEVVVVSGKVSFYSEINPHKNIILTKGMKGIYIAGVDSVYSHQNIDPDFMAWYNDKLIFNNTILKEVIQVLNSRFNVKIQVSDPAILGCKFTSTFENATLLEILKVVELSLELDYTQEGNNYILKGKGC